MSSPAKSSTKPHDVDNRAYHRTRAMQERALAGRASTDVARAIHAELAALHEAAVNA